MTRRFGVVSRLGESDKIWMLRQFRATLAEAEAAEVESAQELIDLGWTEAVTSIVSFNADGLRQLDGYRNKTLDQYGELALQMRDPYTQLLDVRATNPVHKARKVRQVVG